MAVINPHFFPSCECASGSSIEFHTICFATSLGLSGQQNEHIFPQINPKNLQMTFFKSNNYSCPIFHNFDISNSTFQNKDLFICGLGVSRHCLNQINSGSKPLHCLVPNTPQYKTVCQIFRQINKILNMLSRS